MDTKARLKGTRTKWLRRSGDDRTDRIPLLRYRAALKCKDLKGAEEKLGSKNNDAKFETRRLKSGILPRSKAEADEHRPGEHHLNIRFPGIGEGEQALLRITYRTEDLPTARQTITKVVRPTTATRSKSHGAGSVGKVIYDYRSLLHAEGDRRAEEL